MITTELPRYARAGDGEFYTWDGQQFPRVTGILSLAPGEHLMNWYAKRAAQRACVHLMSAGIKDPFEDEALFEHAQSYDDPPRSIEEAHEEIFNWAMVMRDAERYRDYKGLLGSLTHHALYETVMGRRPPGKTHVDPQLIDYLGASASRLRLLHSPDGEEPRAQDVHQLAVASAPYVVSALDLLDESQLEFEMIGAEACVVSEQYGYAGTVDAIATAKTYLIPSLKKIFPSKRTVRVLLDFKTSKSLSKSFEYQMEAYRNADFIGLFPDGSQHELGEFDALAIAHIRPHEVSHIVPKEPNDVVFGGFLGLLDYYQSLRGITSRRRAAKPKQPPMRTNARPAPFGGISA